MGKSLNYNFSVQKEPKKRMGQNSFANLPNEPIMKKFDNKPNYRGGNVNSFTQNISEMSDIYENHRSK